MLIRLARAALFGWLVGAALGIVLFGCASAPPPYLCARAVTTDGMPVLYCAPVPQRPSVAD